jgi:hypothetical protein
MSKNSSKVAVILLSAVLASGCFSSGEGGNTPVPRTGGNTSPKPPIVTNTPKPEAVVKVVTLTPDLSKRSNLNPNYISFNTGFMFINPIEQEPEVKVIMQQIAPKVLRFPGGTIGNYYHPTGLGYGLRPEETGPKLSEIVKAQPQFKQNAIYHFADVCKMAGSKVMFVANMLTGTVDEMLFCLKFFKERNIEIAGVELGNEFYFREYRETFPDVETYIQKARVFAVALKKFDSKIPVAVVAADPTEPNPKNEHARFMNRWNQILGKESFYHAYVPHLYPKVKGCEEQGGENLKAVFDCINVTLATDHFRYHEIVTEHYKQFYGNKKMWVTEWNVDAANTTANTLRHAAFVSEFLMGLIDANNNNSNLIEHAFFHNLGSNGYAAPIFSLTHQKQVRYLKRVGNIAYNTTYYPFLYLSNLIKSGAQRLESKIQYPAGTDNLSFVARTFISRDAKKIYVYFANKGPQTVALDLGVQNATASSIQAITGAYPWSVAGLNGFYLKQPGDVDLIKELKQNLPSGTANVPAYAVGVLEYRLP